jgi:hypothetical protein
MRNIITLNENTPNKNRQNATTEQNQDNTPHNPFSQSADQFAMQLAEDDKYDPDLVANPAGNRGYTLQPD